MQSSLNTVKLSGDLELQYLEQGEPGGVPVIFLHGVTDSYRSWDLVRPHLPPYIRAYAITQRGHGESSKPVSGYDPANFAEDLREFMEAVGIGSATIAGHSMGSFAAQRFAIDNPQMVDGIVLIGSFATCMDNQGVIEFTATEISGLKDPISPEFANMFQSSTVAKDVDPEFFRTAVGESLKTPARVWKEACEGMIANDHTEELSQIKAPALLIWGDQDAYFGHSEQVRLLERIEGSQLKVYPGDGHAPHWESPERVASDIVYFAVRRAFRSVQVSAYA